MIGDGCIEPVRQHQFVLWLKPDCVRNLICEDWREKTRKKRKWGCKELRVKTEEERKMRVRARDWKVWVKAVLCDFVCVCVNVNESVGVLERERERECVFHPMCVFFILFSYFFIFLIAKSDRIFGSDPISPDPMTIRSSWLN